MDTITNTKEFYEGEAVAIRGVEYIVPGLSLGQVERFADKIAAVTAGGEALSKEMVQTISEVIHAALSRNYPEMTLDEVKEMLDMRNMNKVFTAVMGASGFKNGERGGNGANGASLKRR